jgi:peptidoglycan/LPS O-acetylase OafA/YrhL
LAVFLLDSLGIFVFHGIASGVYPQDILHTLEPGTLACNAGFLQTAACKPYGDDNALWSLFNEFWYYVLWPLLLLAFTAASKWKRGGFFATAAGLLTFLSVMQNKEYALIAPYMIIWIVGVFVAIVPRPVFRSLPLSAGLFLAALAADRLLVRRTFVDAHTGYMFLIDLGIGILFANMLVTMRAKNRLRPPPGRQANTWFASFSFSLYCIHTPIILVYGAALEYYTGTGWLMAPDHAWQWFAIAGAVVLSVAAAYILSRLTEAHTDKLRRLLIGVLASYRLRASPSSDARNDAVA